MTRLAVLAQGGCDSFRLLAGIAEDEALFPSRVFKNIADPRVCGDGRLIRRGNRFGERNVGRVRCRVRCDISCCGCFCRLPRCCPGCCPGCCSGSGRPHGTDDDGILIGFRLRSGFPCGIGGLWACRIEMLHGEMPGFTGTGHLRDDGAAPGTRREKTSRRFQITDGGGEAHTARMAACRLRQPFEQAQRLPAAVAAHQRMDLVNDDKTQIAEKPHNLAVAPQHQRLEGLGRDLKDAGGAFQQLALLRLRHIAVPVPHRDLRLSAEVIQP